MFGLRIARGTVSDAAVVVDHPCQSWLAAGEHKAKSSAHAVSNRADVLRQHAGILHDHLEDGLKIRYQLTVRNGHPAFAHCIQIFFAARDRQGSSAK